MLQIILNMQEAHYKNFAFGNASVFGQNMIEVNFFL